MSNKSLKDIFMDKVYNYLLYYEILSFGKKFNKETFKGSIEKIYLYYEELLQWNQKINLTAVTDINGFIQRHIIDSAFLLKIMHLGNKNSPDDYGYIMDIGSGAGLPGIIISILMPELKIISVESVLKKCNFQKAAARKLGLSNFKCLNLNIFSYEDYGNIFAIITRAAFNMDELIRLIEKLDLKNDADIYLFLSKTDEVKKIETFKYKSKKVILDRLLFYKTDYSPNKKDNFRLIAKFKVNIICSTNQKIKLKI